jgi:2-polyprenyl-3-methyl-5-hydroxy-6-metoxy-1,4-benzoquinol methylase
VEHCLAAKVLASAYAREPRASRQRDGQPSLATGAVTAGRPVSTGLSLRWQAIRAPRRDGAPSDDGERPFGLWVPDCDLDTLVDQLTQQQFERDDERMPYFGVVWPSAEALATRVLAGPPLDGAHALDLGCGLGACGLAAARRGARVTFFDWEPRALEIVAASAREQGGPAAAFDFVVGDWRRPPPCGPFDLVLAADVLYEPRNVPAVASFLARHLKPGAEAWIADPGRPHAQELPAHARAADLELLGGELLPSRAQHPELTLLRLRRPT